ncbi:hypothetical protein BKA93DRAFT_830378 [Sparassis latifolia]|uniref:DUF6593 domain-containing protein n=1 Tax=Sparassis crispa TaxID=139825 RepID=A0A401G9M6_9APHY|nr:hypothetical protein SCP_0200670 [Sparassis crispa]GBE78870.1 hypothetical protein SCP_0200670 [Sparassis crispa]
MINKTLPFFLEDRTGVFTGSDFDDIYDRLFLRASRSSEKTAQSADETIMIYNMGRRSSSQRDYRPTQREPAIVLEFGPQGALWRISFTGSSISMPMGQYLKKTSMFGGSLSRKFRGSDGEEYKWTYKSVQDQEWTCVDSRNYLVAHYDLKPPEKPAYRTSGNILTIYEAYADLSVEILASLTIMRHIAANNL